MAAAAVAIELKNVSLSFGSAQILTGIDMSVEPGEFVCVIAIVDVQSLLDSIKTVVQMSFV